MLAARSLLRTKASTMSTNLPVEYFEPPRDPTIPGPDQYGDVSKEELPILCVLWRIGALYSRLRERPDEFRREFDKIVGRHDMASRVIKGVANAVAMIHSSSPYFFLEDQFADLTEILGRACDDFGIESQPIHEFYHYQDADLKAAIRAVERLERRLRGEGIDLPTAHPESEGAEHGVLGKPAGSNVATGNENEQNGPAPSLDDIPRFDKESGEWVLRAEAAKRTRLSVGYLGNITSHPGSLKSKDGCRGRDSRGQMWRKEKESSQSVWYYVPSLSDKHS